MIVALPNLEQAQSRGNVHYALACASKNEGIYRSQTAQYLVLTRWDGGRVHATQLVAIFAGKLLEDRMASVAEGSRL